MIDAAEALARLQRGNREFVDSIDNQDILARRARAATLVQTQQPFAVILGCSDARVPAEIVFNQSLGDLFVIRVAGNIASPTQIGSIEFAAATFATPLVVVLGHTQCGAVTAALDDLQHSGESQSPNLAKILDRVRPSVEKLLQTDLRDDREALIHAAVRANVETSARQLRDDSDILDARVQEGTLSIVGAEYAIETGHVTFIDDAPTTAP